MQRRVKKKKLSRKTTHAQKNAVANPPSITESFKSRSSMSHRQHSHAAELTGVSKYSDRFSDQLFLRENRCKVAPDDSSQTDDHELPDLVRRPATNSGQLVPIDEGFTSVKTGDISPDDDPEVVSPKVRQGQTLCREPVSMLSSSFPSRLMEDDEELPDIVGPGYQLQILPRNTNNGTNKEPVSKARCSSFPLKDTKTCTQAKKSVSPREERSNCDRPSTKLSNPTASPKPRSFQLVDVDFGFSSSSPSPVVARRKKCTAASRNGEKFRDTSVSSKKSGNLKGSDSSLSHDKGSPRRSKERVFCWSSPYCSGSASSLSSPDVARQTKSSVLSKTGNHFVSASSRKDCKSSSNAYLPHDKTHTKVTDKVAGTKSSGKEGSTLFDWKHSGKSFSCDNHSSGNRLDLHPRSHEKDSSWLMLPTLGLPRRQQNGSSPIHASVSPAQQRSDPQKKLSGSQSQSSTNTDSPVQKVQKPKHSVPRRKLLTAEESEHGLTMRKPQSKRSAGKRPKPSSSSPASSPSSISSLSPKCAGHTRSPSQAAKKHKSSTKNCDKSQSLSRYSSPSTSTSKVSSQQLQLAKTVSPSVIHNNSVPSKLKSIQKTQRHVKHVVRETERVEHIASSGSRSSSQTRQPQVTNNVGELGEMPGGRTAFSSNVPSISKKNTKDNGDCDRNYSSVQDDTKDCFVVERSEVDSSPQMMSSRRARSPVFPRKRQSYSSPEENSSSTTPKRRRVNGVDRTPLTNLTGNSKEAASQGSTSRNNR